MPSPRALISDAPPERKMAFLWAAGTSGCNQTPRAEECVRPEARGSRLSSPRSICPASLRDPGVSWTREAADLPKTPHL